MRENVLSKKYVVDVLYKYLTIKQRRLYDLYYLFNRDALKAAKMFIEEYKLKSSRLNEKLIKRNYTKYVLLKLAIDVNNCDIEELREEARVDNPTLEWTLTETMKLYKHADKEFKKYDELVIEYEGKEEKDMDVLGKLINLRDKYQRDMKELLKQITDFQNKFGEMLNDDSLKIGMLSDEALMGELGIYVEEAKEYLSKEKWYAKNKLKVEA